MASTILSDNGVTSGSAGLKTTAASDGALALQTTTAGGTATTALTIDTSQNATFAGSVKTNTLTSASATALTLQSGGTTAITVDASQNVGIGVTPSAKLDIVGSAAQITNGAGASGSRVRLDAPASSGGSYIQLYKDLTPSYVAGIGTALPGGSAASAMVFSDYQGSWTERMRISSSGQLLLGATSNGEGSLFQSSFTVLSVYRTDATGAYGSFAWYSDAGGTKTLRGYTMGNGGLANYSANNTNLSDERLKKDITLSGNYLDKICSIPVKNFRYKDQPETEDITLGVVAQDVQKVAPELVCNEGFGISEERENYLSVYQTDLQYALMKSIQELKAINDTQAETINALTARIVALEQA